MSITLTPTEKTVIDAADGILDDAMKNGVGNTSIAVVPLAGYEKADSVGSPKNDYQPQIKGPFKMALVALMRSVESVTNAVLLNNWINYDTSTYNAAGFYKDPLGIVHLQGLISSGLNAVILVLPSGYRPNKSLLFPCISNNLGIGVIAEIRVDPNGFVTFDSGSNTYVSLESISFRAYQ